MNIIEKIDSMLKLRTKEKEIEEGKKGTDLTPKEKKKEQRKKVCEDE
jgi:hypothetical protein